MAYWTGTDSHKEIRRDLDDDGSYLRYALWHGFWRCDGHAVGAAEQAADSGDFRTDHDIRG